MIAIEEQQSPGAEAYHALFVEEPTLWVVFRRGF
jgi:hypothetical protein